MMGPKRRWGTCVAEIVRLSEAVAELVRDGDTVALEGFTHLIPHAAGHEVIRQERRDLTLVRMTPDVIYDQLIGAGCARGLVFSWGGNPGVGSLHRLRDAVEHGWPGPLEVVEHSHAGMAAAYAAGAAHLPFGVLRGYAGTDLAGRTRVAIVTCPFTGEELAAGILTSDPDRGLALAEQLQAGIVHVNDQPVHDEPQMPFGGVKDSGWGRFGGQAAIDEFTELRWITIQTGPHGYPF